MNEQRPSEVAAAGVRFPVAIVVAGAVGPARVQQWGGKTESPDSLTIFYEAEEIQVTTCPIRLSEDEFADLIAEEVGDWVERSYAWSWWAQQQEALDFTGLDIVETTFVKTEKGYLETRMYESLPAEEEERQRLARKEAASNAEHRVVALALGSLTVDATVVGGSEMWSAGFETPPGEVPLSVLLSGGSVPVDTLKMELVADLVTYLGQAR
ncbi:MAG TPA: hypothetical protein VMT37_09750 [Solirubrobacterales bacterium]|nr:hypothetical protein [Solirubrobacterales bacterium]